MAGDRDRDLDLERERLRDDLDRLLDLKTGFRNFISSGVYYGKEVAVERAKPAVQTQRYVPILVLQGPGFAGNAL